ncbi:MAG: hypothetical protein CM15mP49_32670 [Actinomycetota bacterium]|nr:MAG: hypothetical protein CM15mP49_32670 [Actinomycetota bacterium]
MGGVLVSRTVCDLFEQDPDFVFMHGYTYSGHPAACAAAIANIDLIEKEGLVERAKHIGKRISRALRHLKAMGFYLKFVA